MATDGGPITLYILGAATGVAEDLGEDCGIVIVIDTYLKYTYHIYICIYITIFY